MEKEFITIPDLNLTKYKISREGKIFSTYQKKILKTKITNGYENITLNKKTYSIHRLVALTYIENKDNKPFVNHIDCNKLNNNFKNLEWVTQKENCYLHDKITYHNKVINQYDLQGKFIKSYNSILEASKVIKLSPSSISKVLTGNNLTAGGFKWSYLNNNECKIDFKLCKQIKGFEKYLVFTNGCIYSLNKKNFLKPILNLSGYSYVTLCINKQKFNKYVHRIVAETFLDNKDNKNQVNHKNKIRSDNKLENLEWVTSSENMKHAYNF